MAHPTATRGPGLLMVGVGAWLAVVLTIALSGVLSHAPLLVPVTTTGSIALGVVAYRRSRRLRAFADGLDLRIPILVHVLRAAIGVQILVATSAGVIPTLFGHRAGLGDIAIGVLAIGAAIAVRRAPRLVLAWCLLGILDLVIAFGTGQYLLFVVRDPRMTLIGQLPWALLPTTIVPVMILAHLLVIARLRRR